MASAYDATVFREKLKSALGRIATVLGSDRDVVAADPGYAHTWGDKYGLADSLVNTALAAIVNCLHAIGTKPSHWEKLIPVVRSSGSTVSLRFEVVEECKFYREETREQESNTREVLESSQGTTWTSKTITKITEYFWAFNVQYELYFVIGNRRTDKSLMISSRSARTMISTSINTQPRPSTVRRDPLEVDITWMLERCSPAELSTSFSIDRESRACKTPRRNPQVQEAILFFSSMMTFASKFMDYFVDILFPTQQRHSLDLNSIKTNSLFVPIVPLFSSKPVAAEEKKKDEDSLLVFQHEHFQDHDDKSVVVRPTQMNRLLQEQAKSIADKKADFQQVFASGKELITPSDAFLVLVTKHISDCCIQLGQGLDFIEDMLRNQLISAIGKEVSPADFTKYMIFHNRKIMAEEHAPIPFCHAIRRPEHYPEGVLSIEAQINGETLANPIYTVVRHMRADTPMQFEINAATRVSLYGDRYLHSWVTHQFSNQAGFTLSLNARARQFSSFILLVGNVNSSKSFTPKFGIIIENKDDLKIPLMLETIPTAKQFRDAISSLSPEQQRFAKAYRSMQLESTVFGVVVVQIKPQLEKLLKLPPDSLTKEIRLTQDIMEMFTKYQIPSDLLSYSGEEEVDNRSKVDFVKQQVQEMRAVIGAMKAETLSERKQEQMYKRPLPKATDSFDDFLFSAAPASANVASNYAYAEDDNLDFPEFEAISPKAKVETKKKASRAPVESPMFAAAKPAAAAIPAVMQPVAVPGPRVVVSEAAKTEIDDLKEEGPGVAAGDAGSVDFSKIPSILDAKFAVLDEDNALRPTIMKTGSPWIKKSQKNLLTPVTTETIESSKQDSERDRAFDLLDALSRSGSLPFDEASLHVIVGVTHCFDKTLTNTVIQENTNPIERVERSVLLIASTIKDKPVLELVRAEEQLRVQNMFPDLIQN
eukprot:TRINITY_DN60812_c0_g1_i1.p1 TRINITY_DN60812_c0_g1~~TRINITY_DN60812_c0_g1_i1.p1  ORF type:complete len:946 (+),score=253.54 TRINITY_DN60812_c0_g1_i1:36-2840(+)